jgi:NADH-quinone oxidoreductase subunit L
MRFMGGLRRQMPITAITAVFGTLALVGFPFFSGFYSKDVIIEAVGLSSRFGSGVSYWLVEMGVFITALYSFRLLYLVFFGAPRYTVDPGISEGVDEGAQAEGHHQDHGLHAPDGQLEHAPRECPPVVTVPLILLAVPSVLIGWLTVEPLLFGGWLADSITVAPGNDVVARFAEDFHGATAMGLHALQTLPFWLMVAGIALATVLYLLSSGLPARVAQRLPVLHRLLEHKYYFDELYQRLFVGGVLSLGRNLWRRADMGLIDGGLVNGSARLIHELAARVRRWQTGFLYDYAFSMIIGVIVILGFWVVLD